MRLKLPPPASLRALCLFAFAAVLLQLFVLAQAPLVRELANFFWDKVVHALAFGSIAMLLWVGIGFRAPLLNWGIVTVVGALDEFHQLFVPTRSADVFDMLADSLGAAVVTFILHRLATAPAREVVAPEVVVETGD